MVVNSEFRLLTVKYCNHRMIDSNEDLHQSHSTDSLDPGFRAKGIDISVVLWVKTVIKTSASILKQGCISPRLCQRRFGYASVSMHRLHWSHGQPRRLAFTLTIMTVVCSTVLQHNTG